MTTTATDALQSVAEDLLAAYETSQTIRPPRETIANLDVSGAYRIQQLQEQAFIDRGEKVIGRKIGLTSLAMQRQLGVDSPDFGFFT
ncbi:2-keto-4-pentenoate hydratase, partial [Corynebacterium sp. A21]